MKKIEQGIVPEYDHHQLQGGVVFDGGISVSLLEEVDLGGSTSAQAA